MEGNIISTLIQTAVEKQTAEEAYRKANIALARQGIEAAFRTAIGEELWTTLHPYMFASFSYNERSSSLIVEVQAAALELHPFCFWVQGGARLDGQPADFYVKVIPAGHHPHPSNGKPLDELGKVLADARQKFPAWNKERLEKLTSPLIFKLGNCTHDMFAQSAEEADQVYAQLVEIDPENDQRWQELRAHWTATKNHHDAQLREAERARLAKEQELDMYEIALEAYARKALDTIQANRAKCQDLQSHLNGKITYWKLTYALLGEDEDGVQAVETEMVNVSNSHDDNGFWPVLKNSQETLVRFFHPVMLEGPFEVEINGDQPYDVVGHWTPADTNGFTLYYRPGLDIRTVIKALDLQAVPEFPAMPDIHYHWENARIDQIRAQVPERLIASGYQPDDVYSLLGRANRN